MSTERQIVPGQRFRAKEWSNAQGKTIIGAAIYTTETVTDTLITARDSHNVEVEFDLKECVPLDEPPVIKKYDPFEL
jgi:hypothetical protein